jgi:hypothetical protein
MVVTLLARSIDLAEFGDPRGRVGANSRGAATERAYRCPRPRFGYGRLTPLVRAAWLCPKQTDLVPGKRQLRSRFPQSAQLRLSDNDFWGSPQPTDIISAQHFWTDGLETAGPGCYDAVAIA